VADLPTKDAAARPEFMLSEEEISDIKLGTFYVFDKENTPKLGEQVARACGGCRGCRGCARGCRGCRRCRGCAGCGGCGGCGCGGCGCCIWLGPIRVC
jgi:hypothetical protein